MSLRDLAIALGYDPGSDRAPRVLASGEGPLARRIEEMAVRHGIPTREDGDLAELLRHIPLEDEIPSDLYPAVAEVLAYLWHVARKASDDGDSPIR